jgi:dethiobiotin synthetase
MLLPKKKSNSIPLHVHIFIIHEKIDLKYVCMNALYASQCSPHISARQSNEHIKYGETINEDAKNMDQSRPVRLADAGG